MYKQWLVYNICFYKLTDGTELLIVQSCYRKKIKRKMPAFMPEFLILISAIIRYGC